MKNKIIIGLGFGDEGKGLVTDYLCSKSKTNPIVIRFSGGHQVGHTVVSDFTRHVFSNFGSGTFRGVPTYWSKFCTVEPIGLLNELDVLLSEGISPLLYIDEKCPITTPYDILSNQMEYSNGSVGVGFGETIDRELHLYSLTFFDLFYPEILESKVEKIKEYYYDKWEKKNENKAWSFRLYNINPFLEDCRKLINTINIVKTDQTPRGYDERIYEGSQGLLLDQHYGFYPNVTWSNTGTKNIKELYDQFYKDSEIYLVTRAYQTRHGNGFMTNEQISHNIKENPLETNKSHKYQGEFRRTLLDVSLLEYAINKDDYIRNTENKILVITCLDHIETDYRFTYKGDIIICKNENDFIKKISYILGIKNIYLSHSDNSKNIKKVILDKSGKI